MNCQTWVLRSELRVSVRAVSVFNYSAFSLALDNVSLSTAARQTPRMDSACKRKYATHKELYKKEKKPPLEQPGNK